MYKLQKMKVKLYPSSATIQERIQLDLQKEVPVLLGMP